MIHFQTGHSRLLSRLCLLVLFVLMAACQNETAVPPAGSPTSAGSGTAATPTTAPTIMVTTLPGPVTVGTAIAPTAVVESAATAGLMPTATQSIPGMIGPNNFPAGVNPLTGLVVANPEFLQRRPIAVKVSNIARVRPQSGLNNADLVFEHMTEGTITRFTAVFYGNDSEKIGSVRSGRIVDLEIPVMYDAAFAYSGASGPVPWLGPVASW